MERVLTEPKSQMHVFQTEVIDYEGLVQGSSLNTRLGKIYYVDVEVSWDRKELNDQAEMSFKYHELKAPA